jgi:hypothetical protein
MTELYESCLASAIARWAHWPLGHRAPPDGPPGLELSDLKLYSYTIWFDSVTSELQKQMKSNLCTATLSRVQTCIICPIRSPYPYRRRVSWSHTWTGNDTRIMIRDLDTPLWYGPSHVAWVFVRSSKVQWWYNALIMTIIGGVHNLIRGLIQHADTDTVIGSGKWSCLDPPLETIVFLKLKFYTRTR